MTDEGKLLLVPKAVVRRKLDYNSSDYLNHYLLTYIQDAEVAAGSEFVRLLKSGAVRPPSKKSLKQRFGSDKQAIARLTRQYPGALDNFRNAKRDSVQSPMSHEDFFVEGVGDPPDLSALLAAVLAVPPGRNTADNFHRAVEKLLSALFYPGLSSPQVEYPIHGGRKRIDIAYSNVAQRGFFAWLSQHYPSALLFNARTTQRIR